MEKNTSCKICGNTSNNKFFVAKELMHKTHHDFQYIECSRCKCIQIIDVPENIADYYPENYLSFKEPSFATKMTSFRYFLRKKMTTQYIGKASFLGFVLSILYKNPFPWLKRNTVNFDSHILEIGCGTGRLLLSMQRSGFKNLTGIDPFNHSDIKFDNAVSIYKKTLFELTEKYDLIMLHHSFEHMQDPLEVLIKLNESLNENGTLLIRIPVGNCFAWRKYGLHWVQLDAPRHFYIHNTTSLSILAQKAGLKIVDINYESKAFQFEFSEKYMRGYDFNSEIKLFSKKEMKAFQKEAERLNSINDGDCACFYLKKNDLNLI